MTSVDGNAITYDTSGNPLTYYNGMSFTWQDGRKLASLTGTGISANYEYNGDGLRTKKTIVEGTEQYTVEYFYEGNKLIALEKVQGTTIDYMFFLYDQSDNIVGFELNGTAYYYSKNLQGDVLSILDSNGDVVVKYTYTAWGELISVTDGDGNEITDSTSVAYLNPIRYRGYVYDDEIGMYYLQSRYYDPSISRFINADSAEYIGASGTILSENLFAYCENNPTFNVDFSGYLPAKVRAIVNRISVGMLFAKYSSGLFSSFAATLTKIGAYVTGLLSPKVTALFFWNPWVVAGIVVAAVAIVVTGVSIYRNRKVTQINNANMDKTVREILKNKKGSIKNAPLPPGGPHWDDDDILKKTLREIKQLAQKNVKGYKEIYKLLTDARFNR